MKKIGIALIILAIAALLFFFILPFGQNKFSPTIEEKPQIFTEDLKKKYDWNLMTK